MAIVKTGVKCTPEELEQLKQLASRGWKPGDMVIVSSIAQGIQRDQATIDAQKVCHQLALSHGLPEIPGYYGMMLDDGEFVRT